MEFRRQKNYRDWDVSEDVLEFDKDFNSRFKDNFISIVYWLVTKTAMDMLHLTYPSKSIDENYEKRWKIELSKYGKEGYLFNKYFLSDSSRWNPFRDEVRKSTEKAIQWLNQFREIHIFVFDFQIDKNYSLWIEIDKYGEVKFLITDNTFRQFKVIWKNYPEQDDYQLTFLWYFILSNWNAVTEYAESYTKKQVIVMDRQLEGEIEKIRNFDVD